MAPYRYTSPASVGSLVLPVGYLKLKQFNQYFDRLQEASKVPLIDVHIPDSTTQPASLRTTFDPQKNPTGNVKFHFSKKTVPPQYHQFFDIEPWRQQMFVLGIMHYSDFINQKSDNKLKDLSLDFILSKLRKDYPYGLYHAVFIFGIPEDSQSVNGLPSNVFPILSSNWTSLETVMSHVTGEFLAQLSVFWMSRKMSSFCSPLEVPSTSTTTSNATSATTASGSGHRRQTSAEPAVLKHGEINMRNTDKAVIKQEGRTKKFLANLYLLSGFYELALAEFGSASLILKDCNDHLWFGSSLESTGFCLVCRRFERGLSSGAPQAAYSSAWNVASRMVRHKRAPAALAGGTTGTIGNSATGGNAGNGTESSAASIASNTTSNTGSGTDITGTGTGTSGGKRKPFNDQTPIEILIDFLMHAASDEMQTGTGKEQVPHLLYFEMLVRYVNLLICLRLGGGWNDISLAAACLETSIPENTQQEVTLIPVQLLEEWIERILSPKLSELAPELQVTILSAVAVLYMKVGMKRKWAFTCSRIFMMLAASTEVMTTDLKLVDQVLTTYKTWPNLKASTLRTLVALGQRMKNPQVQIEAASKLLAISNQIYMPDKEQLTLYHLVRSYSDVVHCEFWDKNMLLNISVKSSKLTTVKPTKTNQKSTDSPFIYDPFEGTITKDENTVEAGVSTLARIYLRNSLAIEIQLVELWLVNSHGECVSEVVKDVVIPGNCSRYKIEASIMPKDNTKHLEIDGCMVQVSGCAPFLFKYPQIKIPIIPERPVLVLQELTIYKGWIMLLEGEKVHFSIQLWNSSEKTPCKCLNFVFLDSSIENLRPILSKQDLPRALSYEHEFYLHNKKVLEMVQPQPQPQPQSQSGDEQGGISPRSSKKYDFELLGKRGVTSASIFVDYGYDEDTLRRLKIPLQITVYPSVNIERAMVLPTSKSCTVMLVLDVQNLWKQELEAEFEVHDNTATETKQTVKSLIKPNQTKRMFIELPWKINSLDDLCKPIPSFRKRQFIVDKKTSKQQLRAFWLREILLSKLSGKWRTTDDGGSRFGEIDIRTIQLTKKMFAILEPTIAELSMESYSYNVKVDEVVNIRILAMNTSVSSELTGLLRLVASKPSEDLMLFIGPSQQIIKLKPGESQLVEFAVVFIGSGTFDIASLLDMFNENGAINPEANSVFQPQKTVYNVTN